MHFLNQFNTKLCIKNHSSQEFIISGYASVFNVADLHNDIIIKGAFKNAKSLPHNVKLLWQHDYLTPIGIVKNLEEDNYGLKVEAIINSKIRAGKEAIELVKQGAIDSFSIGFHITSYNFNDQGQRLITELKLMEISLVTFPANQQAQIEQACSLNPNSQLEELKSEINKLFFLTTNSVRIN